MKNIFQSKVFYLLSVSYSNNPLPNPDSGSQSGAVLSKPVVGGVIKTVEGDHNLRFQITISEILG